MVAETHSLGSNVVEEKRLSLSVGEVQKALSPASQRVDGGVQAWCTLLGGWVSDITTT